MTTPDIKLEVEIDPTGLPNMAQNPSGELGTWAYVTPVATTLLTRANFASPYLQFTAVSSAPSYFTTEYLPINAGQYVASRMDIVGQSGGHNFKIRYVWYDANKAQLSTSTQSSALTATTVYGPVIVAPASTKYVKMRVDLYNGSGNPDAASYIQFNKVMVTKAATSGALTSPFSVTNPVEYTNILGPTHEVKIDRSALNVGILTAEVFDSALDPAIADTIRPGRRVRVTAYNSVSSKYESIYTGKIDQASTNYVLAKGGDPSDPKVAHITLSATDNIAALARQMVPSGSSTAEGLAFVLEGKGVPWNINGSGSQPPGTLATNGQQGLAEQASLLDQIAITRDSVKAYAWVDKQGVLQFWEATDISGTSMATFDDETGLSYTDIDATFSTDECINSVSVTWLKLVGNNPNNTTVVEVPLGPYEDAASIETWGPHTRTFTIYAANAAAVATFANAVLTANATPERKANSLTMRVKTTDEKTAAIGLDLYDLVTVNYADRIGDTFRIASINHTITPKTWQTVYAFSTDGNYASPIVTGASGAVVTAAGWQAPSFASGWANYGSGIQDVRYKKEGATVTLQGLIKRTGSNAAVNTIMFTLPDGYKPPAALVFTGLASVTGTGEVVCGVYIDTSGNVRCSTAGINTNGYVYMNVPPFTID